MSNITGRLISTRQAISAGIEVGLYKGESPYIGANGHWYAYDDTQNAVVDTGVNAQGDEASRLAAELERAAAELARSGAEGDRAAAEGLRATAETIRAQAEGLRTDAESARVAAEAVRAAASASATDAANAAAVSVGGMTVAAETVSGNAPTATISDVDGHKHIAFGLVKGVVSILRTSGTGAPGTTDTYTITYSDGSSATFDVRNGADGLGAGDMLASVYDVDGDGIVDKAAALTGTVAQSQVTGLSDALSGKAAASHNHAQSDITGLGSTLTGKVDKIPGKGLSTNDLTDALKAQYDAGYTHSLAAHAPSDATKNVVSRYTATIGTTWTGSAPPFAQQIAVTGILATDYPDVDIVQTGTEATDSVMREVWGKVTRIVAGAGSITVYAEDAIATAILIQLKVVR